MRETLSSEQTFLWKYLLPGIFLAVAAWLVVALVLRPILRGGASPVLILGVLLYCIGVAVGFWKLALPLKKVSLEGDHLLVSNDLREIAVPLYEIENIHGHWRPYTGLWWIHLRFKQPSPFGARIAFLADANRPLTKPHPVVTRVQQLAGQAKEQETL